MYDESNIINMIDKILNTESSDQYAILKDIYEIMHAYSWNNSINLSYLRKSQSFLKTDVEKSNYFLSKAIKITEDLVNKNEVAQKILFEKIKNSTNINLEKNITPVKTQLDNDNINNNIKILLINDYATDKADIESELKKITSHCVTIESADALQYIDKKAKENHLYDIIIVAANKFDHHIGYVARLIKSNYAFRDVSIILTLPNASNQYNDIVCANGFSSLVNSSEISKLKTTIINVHNKKVSSGTISYNVDSVSENNVLIVDDDILQSKIISTIIGKLGYNAEYVNDGTSAMQNLQNKKYSIIIMDIGLPDISGLEITYWFRKLEKANKMPRTPIIGLTVMAMQNDISRGLAYGMDEYLIKPIDQSILKDLLKKWVKLHG